MESSQAPLKQTVWIGDFSVVETTSNTITIQLGGKVTITLYTKNFPHIAQVGDKIPLYAELPYGKSSEPPVQ